MSHSTSTSGKREESATAQSSAEWFSAQTITVGPDPRWWRRGRRREIRAHLLEQRRVLGAVRLVEPVGEGHREQILGLRGHGGTERGRAADRVDGVSERHLLGQRGPRLGCRHRRRWDERDRGERDVVRETLDPPADSQAGPAGKRGREVVRAAFQPALREEPFRVGLPVGDMRGGDQAECDDGRARAETWLAGNAVEPLEAEPVGGVDALESLDSEVLAMGVPPSVMTTSFQRSSATAAQSNPAPRLAVVAGRGR